MPRPPRLEIAGGIFHVTARGNRRQTIYEDDQDRLSFVVLQDRTVFRHGWRPIAYCLLPNPFTC